MNLAASLHLDLVTPNFLCQEQIHLGQGLIKRPFEVRDGYIEAPTGPGLGIDLDPAVFESTWDGNWTLPNWRDPIDEALLPW